MTDSKADPLAARLLKVAIHSLRRDILPALTDDATRIRLDHITRLMRAASALTSRRRDALEKLVEAARRCGGLDVPALVGDVTVEKLERQRCAIENSISLALPALLDAAGGGDAAALRRLEAIVAFEKEFFVSQDADILKGSQVAYRGGRVDEEPTPVPLDRQLDEPSLTAYLRQRFGHDGVNASGVRPIPGGFSKETVFFTLEDQRAGTRQDLVIRKDISEPFIDQTVTDEFPILSALHARGFEVARPVWLETDRGFFGAPFMVSERVAGTSNAATWAGDRDRAAKSCRELARILAQLHAFVPAELGFAADRASLSAGLLMEGQVDRWTRLYHDRKREPVPTQEVSLVWLRRNIPKALYERPARLVHGDVGFHNLMFDDQGDVTALLDWEFTILGDPTQDLCFVRLFVEPLMEWNTFLELYRSFGGQPPCDEAMFFFDLWTKTRNSIGCVASQALFDTSMPREVKFALSGHIFGPYLYIEECETVIAQLKQGRG